MIQDGDWRTTMTTQTEWKWLARWVRPRGEGGVHVQKEDKFVRNLGRMHTTLLVYT